MDTQEILYRAADLIAQTDAFHKGAFAVDNDGDPVPPKSKHACAWCMLGAIAHVSPNRDATNAATLALLKQIGYTIATYNDDKRTTQASAVRKLRQAARAAA